ncbi:hypothetical protein ACFWM7_25145 [Streptomyces sp. NPDC058375]
MTGPTPPTMTGPAPSAASPVAVGPALLPHPHHIRTEESQP